MYAHIDQFAIDKALNTIVEEGIAPKYIQAFHALKGRKIWRVEKNLADLNGSRAYDLIDGMGIRWEVKYDRLWHVTGNVYIEIQALEASEADNYLIFAGRGYVTSKSALVEAITPYLTADREGNTRGGDLGKSLGVPLPLEVLEGISEKVIVL